MSSGGDHLEPEILLALDTSTQWIGLALYDGSQVLAETTWRSYNHHTVELSPAIEELLAHCAVRPADLSVLAVATGPGAFTSLRIGLAVAKGLALALHLPVIGVPSLDFLAAGQPVDCNQLIAILQVGRGRLAAGRYTPVDGAWFPAGEAELTTTEELSKSISAPTRVCGELSAAERQLLARKRKNVLLSSPAVSLRRSGHLAELGWRRWQKGLIDDVITLSPIYLHTSADIPA
jgi:tRNA threonylcarbamoyladenosine biosynthesis protein TsaB